MSAHALLEKTYIPPREYSKYSPKKKIPTMYDLPYENPEEDGLPDDFHHYQPQLLRETFCPPHVDREQIYVASDLYLYYDIDHPLWYKRPDWFAVLGVPPLYGPERDLRYSYVVWDEKVPPFVIVELLSESTKKEDLGQTQAKDKKPPPKWEVYEQILKIPYYVIFSRDFEKFRAFELKTGRYCELLLPKQQLWLPKIQIGLGLWYGTYHNIEHQWLRWYDQSGWIPTPVEREKQRVKAAEQRAQAEEKRAFAAEKRAQVAEQQANSAFSEGEQQGEQKKAFEIARNLLAAGIDPATIAQTTGISPDKLAIL